MIERKELLGRIKCGLGLHDIEKIPGRKQWDTYSCMRMWCSHVKFKKIKNKKLTGNGKQG